MRARRAVRLSAAMVVAFASIAHGQTDNSYAPIELTVACDNALLAACQAILLRISARTALSGLRPRAIEADQNGSVNAVCGGTAAGAILSRDSAAWSANRPGCAHHFEYVGRPLFPLYALLVVRSDTWFRQLNDLTRAGRTTEISHGPQFSSAMFTLGIMALLNPSFRRQWNMTKEDAEDGFRRMSDGTIDAFFTVESLGSPFLDQIRMARDSLGKLRFRIIDVRPDDNVMRADDGAGNCLYRLTALDFGGPEPVTTISTDAVMVLGRAFHDAHARGGPVVADVLASAIDATRASVLAETKSPPNWRPAATPCH
jgi:hypothetical protein